MKINNLLIILITSLLLQNCSEKKENLIHVIAHRGGSNLAPENTIAAIDIALKLGVDMIEVDVILSKDKEVIVIHDNTIDRTTNGLGKVKNMTLQEIKEFDAGSWFDDKYLGEKIPTLKEVIEKINSQAKLLIEIKGGDEEYPGLEKKVIQLIEQFNAEGWTIVQSFNYNTILRIKKINPNLVLTYLLGRNFEDYFKNLVTDLKSKQKINQLYAGIAPHYSYLDSHKVEVFEDAGFKIFTWTVNKREDMRRMIELKVDGIITDSPDILIEMIKNASTL